MNVLVFLKLLILLLILLLNNDLITINFVSSNIIIII